MDYFYRIEEYEDDFRVVGVRIVDGSVVARRVYTGFKTLNHARIAIYILISKQLDFLSESDEKLYEEKFNGPWVNGECHVEWN